MNFVKSTAGIITGIGLVILILIAYTKCDDLKGAWYRSHMASANAHGDTAQIAKATADSIAKASVGDSIRHSVLISTPEVRSNPVAMRVVTSSNKVIANKVAENKSLREANKQLDQQVKDTKAAGEKPVPRLIPYADALYSFKLDSLTTKGNVVVRAGIDYRLYKYVSAKVEYEHDVGHRVNVGIHIAFK